MKSMRSIVLLALWLLAVPASAPAQSGEGIPGISERPAPTPEGQAWIERMPTRSTLRRLPGFTKRPAPTPEGQPRLERAPGRIALRRRQAAPPPSGGESKSLVLSIAGDRGKGATRAPLALVDFTDYQCPFCARHIRETWPLLETEYVNRGTLRYIVRDFPMEGLHPLALKAAEAARCAGAQGQFWEMHRLLFANQRALGPSEFPKHTAALGLDLGKFQDCQDKGVQAAHVRRDLAEGRRAGVHGAPTFFLGVIEDDARVRVVQVIRGAQPFAAFKAAIDAALQQERGAPESHRLSP